MSNKNIDKEWVRFKIEEVVLACLKEKENENWVGSVWKGSTNVAITEATQSINQHITAIVREIIGEDEKFSKPTTKRRTYAEIARYSKQALKSKQRAKAKELGIEV